MLLNATAIERLQKIICVISFYENNNKHVKDNHLKNNFGHNILDIHKKHFSKYIHTNESNYIEEVLRILTEIVTVKNGYRYDNFDLYNENIFNVNSHIDKILNLFDNVNVLNRSNLSWEIINVILKKYISILVKIIWDNYKKYDIYTLTLQEFVTKGYNEICLSTEISNLLASENEKSINANHKNKTI